jgi:hypothetical protein
MNPRQAVSLTRDVRERTRQCRCSWISPSGLVDGSAALGHSAPYSSAFAMLKAPSRAVASGTPRLWGPRCLLAKGNGELALGATRVWAARGLGALRSVLALEEQGKRLSHYFDAHVCVGCTGLTSNGSCRVRRESRDWWRCREALSSSPQLRSSPLRRPSRCL